MQGLIWAQATALCDAIYPLIWTQLSQNQNFGGLQVILEGNLINLDVTAPGATLALGLMYLKTGDAAVARAFAIPDTHFALNYVKPELILLRVLARGMGLISYQLDLCVSMVG